MLPECARGLHARGLAIDWAATERNLGGVYAARIRGERADNLEQAIAGYAAALEIYTRESNPMLWAQTQGELAAVYVNRIRGDRSENVEQALAHYDDTLTVLTAETLPGDWATTQVNLGNAYLERIAGDRARNIERAIGCYVDALRCGRARPIPSSGPRFRATLAARISSACAATAPKTWNRRLGASIRRSTVTTREALPEGWASLRFNQGTTCPRPG